MRKEGHITIAFSFQNIKNPRLLPRFSDRLCRGSSLYIILRKKGWFKNIKFQEKVIVLTHNSGRCVNYNLSGG